MPRSMQVAVGAVALLALGGCGKTAAATDSASRHAASSHLVNASSVPITYSPEGTDKQSVLQPGDDVTAAGGAWAVPLGFQCTWKYTRGASGAVIARSDTYVAWTTFGGYDGTVTSCVGPAS